MASDMRVSNAMGVPIPQWLLNQLIQRSKQMTVLDNRSNDNIKYLANKTAWVRLVSSVDVNDSKDRLHFNTDNPQDLAKKFMLQGGSRIYKNPSVLSSNNSEIIPSSYQRSGLNEAYNVAGSEEIKTYGYRPMPGLGAVKIVTQGKMGSIRSAEIEIKVWDKLQLDIIDALYFKLGYSMFLEWGHTYYYNNNGELANTEELSIDPFAGNDTKESIYNKIAKNIRKSDGNYDAMLGLVTNFNFTYNQEGGYDCTLKLQALGVLAGGIKINNPRILPDLANDVIKRIYNTLERVKEDTRKRNEPPPPPPPPADPNKFTFEKFLSNINSDATSKEFTIPNSDTKNPDLYSTSTSAIGDVYLVTRYKAIVPIKDEYKKEIKPNKKLSDLIIQNKKSLLDEIIRVENLQDKPTSAVDAAIKKVNDFLAFAGDGNVEFGTRVPYDNGNFGIKIESTKLGDSKNQSNDQSKENVKYTIINETDTFTVDEVFNATIQVLSNTNNSYNVDKIKKVPFKDKNGVDSWRTEITFTIRPGIVKKTEVVYDAYVDPSKNQTIRGRRETIDITYIFPTKITIDDSALIGGIKVDDKIIQPTDYVSQNVIGIATPVAEPEKPSVDDVQKSESLKYQSAFETVIRTIQLYSLDSALTSNIEQDLLVKKLDLTDSRNYNSFTKELFSIGLFSKNLDFLIKKQDLKQICESYDNSTIGSQNSQITEFDVRSKFGFHFGLMSNSTTATELYEKNLSVDFSKLMTTYTVPYEFNTGIIEGTQINHPVYISLGFVVMIINHICSIYDTKKETTASETTPMVYFDFNTESNICLSNKKHLTTNPYEVLIRFEGENKDFISVLDPTVVQGANIKSNGTGSATPIFKPDQEDRLSSSLPYFKFRDSANAIDAYRGKTMNILLSVDYILKIVKQYTKEDSSGDIYAKPFIEQILFNVNKCLGDFNMFRLAYSDYGNTFYIVDDQFTPNLESDHINIDNKRELPLFGVGSIARNLEIRTDISSRLSNVIAISANSNVDNLSTLSKNGDSFGQYNLGFTDRYIPNRTEFKSNIVLPTNTMIDSANQFNSAIASYYSKAKPADSGIDHVTSYYIQRMSKLKAEDKATKASAIIPVSLNFSIDGISAVAMGQAFTINDMYLPYTYNLSEREIGGASDKQNMLGFVIVGLDQTINNNQWISNVRANMLYMKKVQDFVQDPLKTDYAPAIAFDKANQSYDIGKVSLSDLNVNQPWENIAFDFISAREGFIEKPKPDEGTLRAGYGTDTIILADGTKKRVGSDTVFTREDGKRTLIYQIKSDYSKRVINKIGQQSWDALNDKQKAALVSFSYNVGSINNDIASAIKSNTGSNIVANAIASGPTTGAQSGKVYQALVERRKLEATLYLS